ncbi:MAG: outer membrane beta-barrel protein [Paraprevotella sp.]|nr:outer membrane beta-barrel protein [Paraprevotella sp.]
MKHLKTIISVLALWIVHAAYGQEFFNFGMYGRANMSKPNYEFIDFDNRFGGDIGFILETGWKWGYLEYGLGYSNVGMKYKCNYALNSLYSQEHSEDGKITYRGIGQYIDIPVAVAFRLANKKGYGISVSGGGYMSIGVAGKINIENQFTSYTFQAIDFTDTWEYETKLFGDETHQYKRFDAGWKVGMNIHLGKVVRIGAEYRQGAINLSQLEGAKLTNKVFNLSLILMMKRWGD